MTNNPTIDGVSRELLEDAANNKPITPRLDDYCCIGCGRWMPHGHPEAHEHEDDCQELLRAEEDHWRPRLRALLDAPAVERQGDPVGSFDKHMEYMQENIRLQSTIAQLQARVDELESARGESAHHLHESVSWPGKHAAPPAPVAMVFEFEHPSSKEKRTVTLTKQDVFDGMEDYFYDKLGEQICQCESVGETNVIDCNCDEYVHDFEIVNACLDATAALNEARK